MFNCILLCQKTSNYKVKYKKYVFLYIFNGSLKVPNYCIELYLFSTVVSP